MDEMPRITGTVTIYSTYWTPEEVDGQTVPRYADEPWIEVHENVTAIEAARIVSDAGLSFAETGNHWATDPDGSYTSNYGTGEQCERAATVESFPPRLVDAIARKVG